MNTATLKNPAPSQDWFSKANGLLPGLLLAGAIALTATWAAQLSLIKNNGFSPLTLAILIGLMIGNTAYPFIAKPCASGIAFSKNSLLRTGIVLYGLRLTFQDMGQVGMAAVFIDALVLGSTFLIAQWVGQKLLGMDPRTTLLVGAGASICGAAAVLATEPVAKGRAEDVALAVATVVVFGTVATFAYPALFHWNAEYGWLHISAQQYGVFAGSTIHEVAQVVAAGEAVGREAADTAVISKMVRVMMLAPFLLLLSIWLSRSERRDAANQGQARGKITIPWFALGFVAMTGINSLNLLPQAVVNVGIELDNALLAMAMAALGLTTHIHAVRSAGAKPLILALILFAWLLGAGLFLNLWIPTLF